MSEIIRYRTTIDKLVFPPVIYKYREAENTFHQAILNTGKVYFSPPSGFEDTLDCKIPIRYDLLTDDDIFNKYYYELRQNYPHYNEGYLIAWAKKWARLGLMRDKKHIENEELQYWKELNNRFGVLCLTADCKNPAMWDKYSSKLNGFCIGFDPKIMFPHLGGGGEVSYVEELPIIMPFEDNDLQHQKLVFSKEQKWSFEKEYRTHKFWPRTATNEDRNIKLPCESFTELIIGERVQAGVRATLRDSGRQLNPNIKIFSACLINGEINIES